MAAEGALNMAIEAVQAPARKEWLNSVGINYGVKDMAADIALAGAGAAALTGIVRGGGRAFRALSDRRGSTGMETLSEMAEDRTIPKDGRDALLYQSRVAHIDEENPVANPALDDIAVHRQNLAETQRAFDEGEQPVYRSFDGEKTAMEPHIVLRGDELGDAPDIKNLRVAAETYYRENLQGTVASRGDIGNVAFTRKGRDKTFSFSGNPEKLRMVPGLKTLIETGEYKGRTALSEPRPDKAVAFHWIEGNVDLGGKRYRAGVTILEDNRGNKFYNFNEDLGRELGRGVSLNRKSGGLGHDSNITNKGDDVNLTLRNPERLAVDTGAERSADDRAPGVSERNSATLEEYSAASKTIAESAPAWEADFKRLLDESPDMKIEMDDGNGGLKTMSLREIAEEMKDDEDMFNAIRVCAIG